jgi:hypothetical protein
MGSANFIAGMAYRNMRDPSLLKAAPIIGEHAEEAQNDDGQGPAPAATSGGGGGSRSERNNNPGNIEDGDWAKSQPGYAGGDGRFAVFESPEAGSAAQGSLLRNNYIEKGHDTVSKIVNRWSNPAESPDANRAYVDYVAGHLGISPDEKISPEDEGKIQQLQQLMAEFEGGTRRAATGGRIERASGGKVDNIEHLIGKLMASAKSAKRVTDKTTEPLLNMPDEHIVKALDVAQQAI